LSLARWIQWKFMKIIETKQGVVLEVSVKPESIDFKVVVKGEEIVVFCRETPVKGKVNKELVKNLSKLFHREVELVSGFASKRKRLLVKDIGKNEAEQILLSK
jgi:uncharacterized protein (TIGR00251 family)